MISRRRSDRVGIFRRHRYTVDVAIGEVRAGEVTGVIDLIEMIGIKGKTL